jgi:hypothetical protein
MTEKNIFPDKIFGNIGEAVQAQILQKKFVKVTEVLY